VARIAPSAATLAVVKRGPDRSWPRNITEVAAPRPDPRSDPQATQKISREELDAVLKRTKSGVRTAVRSQPEIEVEVEVEVEPERFPGPRDSATSELEAEVLRVPAMPSRVVPSSGAMRAAPAAMPVITTSPFEVAAALAQPAAEEAPSATPPAAPPEAAEEPIAAAPVWLTARAALLGGLALAALIAVAALVGFLAGRGGPSP
jgi:hypothetical protein